MFSACNRLIKCPVKYVSAIEVRKASLHYSRPLIHHFTNRSQSIQKIQIKVNETFNQNAINFSKPQNLLDKRQYSTNNNHVLNTYPLKRSQSAQGFGEKYNGLIALDRLISSHHLPNVHVPLPIGLSTQDILNFLNKIMPKFCLQHEWNKLNQLYLTYKKNLELEMPAQNNSLASFLEKEHISFILETIRIKLKQAFDLASEDRNIYSQFSQWLKIERWLKTIEKNKCYVICRSSGDEDVDVINAGGQISISYISPHPRDVFKNLGNVVASNFRFISLKNRLIAGKNPFEQPLKIAVVLQELIGEPRKFENEVKDIPISIVLFTNEPYYTSFELNKEPFRVMRISATYGHGEGVVANTSVMCDNVLVLESKSNPNKLYVIYQNQEKLSRLAPLLNDKQHRDNKDHLSLSLRPNPSELVETPVLSEKNIRRLFELGLMVEKGFGYPTDMELVIKNDTIYPVQARKVQRKLTHPNFINPVLLDKYRQYIAAQASCEVVIGLSETLMIDAPNQILLCDSLAEAQHLYFETLHRLIIVFKPEKSANTHPLVNFSGLGVPVLYSSDSKAINDIINKINIRNQILLVCMQEGRLVLFKGMVEEYGEGPFDYDKLISQGFTTHPATLNFSIDVKPLTPVTYGTKYPAIPLDLHSLLKNLKTVETNEKAKILLKKISEHFFLRNLTEKIQILEKRINQVSKLNSMDPHVHQVIVAAKKLECKTKEAFNEISALAQKLNKISRLEFLFHIKVLDKLLFSTNTQALSGISCMTIQRDIDVAHTLLDYQEKLSAPTFLSREYLDGHLAITDELKQCWEKFILEIDKRFNAGFLDKDDLHRFCKGIQCLRGAKALPLWINIFFNNERAKLSSEINYHGQLFKNILKTFDDSTMELIHKLLSIQKEILIFKSHLSQFAQIDQFSHAFNKLNELSTFFLGPIKREDEQNRFVGLFEKGSSIARLFSIQILKEFVELFDEAIKTFKSSYRIPNTDRVLLFHQMLISYFKIFSNCSQAVVKEENFLIHSSGSLNEYLKQLEECLNIKDFTLTQLQPSPRFSVAAAVLGTGTYFDRHLPKTLDDVFTLIHQNLLSSIGILNELNTPIDFQDLMPKSLQVIIRNTKLFNKIKQTGLSVKENEIALHYNIALNNHSATLDIIFNKENQQIECHLKLLGESYNRWEHIVAYINYLVKFGVLQLNRKPVRSGFQLDLELSFDGSKNESQLQKECDVVFKEFHALFEYSITQKFDQFALNIESRIYVLPPLLAFIKELHSRSEFHLSMHLLIPLVKAGYALDEGGILVRHWTQMISNVSTSDYEMLMFKYLPYIAYLFAALLEKGCIKGLTNQLVNSLLKSGNSPGQFIYELNKYGQGADAAKLYINQILFESVNLGFVRNMKEVQTVYKVIHQLVQNGQAHEVAMRVIEDAFKRHFQQLDSNLQPKTVLYSSLINSLGSELIKQGMYVGRLNQLQAHLTNNMGYLGER